MSTTRDKHHVTMTHPELGEAKVVASAVPVWEDREWSVADEQELADTDSPVSAAEVASSVPTDPQTGAPLAADTQTAEPASSTSTDRGTARPKP